MSEADKVLGYLRSISPDRATNEEIRVNTGVKPHPKVYQITQRLVKTGEIEGRKAGLEWVFWTEAQIEHEMPRPAAEQMLPDPAAEQRLPEEPARGSNADKVFGYLRSISPGRATNDQIRVNTGVKPNPEVFQITQRLLKAGLIDGRKAGLDWVFWVGSQAEREVPERRAKQAAPKRTAERVAPKPPPKREAPRPAGEEQAPKLMAKREVPEPTAERAVPKPAAEQQAPKAMAGPEVPKPMPEREPPKPTAERDAPTPTAEREAPRPEAEQQAPEAMAGPAVPEPMPERELPKRTAERATPKPMDVSEPLAAPERKLERLSPSQFETVARRVMSEHFDAKLDPGTVPGVHREFGLVSADRRIVGDAKYCSRLRDDLLPLADFSMIAEHVWFLEKTDARYRFLAFGNDEQVALRWLERYGNLTRDVEFYYLSEDGRLKRLASS
jgi:hypothetical protein